MGGDHGRRWDDVIVDDANGGDDMSQDTLRLDGAPDASESPLASTEEAARAPDASDSSLGGGVDPLGDPTTFHPQEVPSQSGNEVESRQPPAGGSGGVFEQMLDDQLADSMLPMAQTACCLTSRSSL